MLTRVDRLLFLCFFASGASALVYEVVWLRWLVHLFGATTLAVSTILTAYMAGLALGSRLAGRWAAAVARPLRAYGLLELAIGAYALALPLLLQGVVPGLRLVGATEASSYTALSLGRFTLAILVLALPTACMGATLPILARFATPRLPQLGGRVGRLYAVNTAGAVLGTAAAGLALLPALGTTLTNQVAVALNVAVGVAAMAVGRRLVEPPTAGAGSGERPAEPSDAIDPSARRAALAAFATIAVSGALAMVYEVAWTRALALVLGSSVYAFTVMLVTFLVGLAGGSYLLARRVDRLVEPGLALGVVQLGIGASALAGVWLLPELPHLFLRLFGWSGGDRLGRPGEARLERWAAIQLDEGEGQRLQRQARLRAAVGHLRWAEHDLRRARDLMPWSLPLHEERARLLERMGERRLAITAWEETGRAFPGHARAWLEIAALWEAERDSARAREALQRYVAAEPNGELRRRAKASLRILSAPSGPGR